MSRTIPGQLDAAAYAALAALNRPSAPDAIHAEVRRLHSTGLKPRDVAAALQLPLPEVLTALTTTDR